MIDRRSLTDHHPSLSGTDYVLEGASVRDRFLTAFILQHNGLLKGLWAQAAGLPDDQPDHSGLSASLLAAEEESFGIEVESTFEPLTIRVLEGWRSGDDEDDI